MNVLNEVRLVVVLRIKELGSALAGVYQCIKGCVMPGTSTSVVG